MAETNPASPQILLRLKRINRILRNIDPQAVEHLPYLIRALYHMLHHFMATRQKCVDERTAKAQPVEEAAEEEDDKEDPAEAKDDPAPPAENNVNNAAPAEPAAE